MFRKGERAVGKGLGTYDEWDEREIQAHKNQVGLPLQIIDDRGRDHDNEKIPDPIGANSYSGSFGSDM